MKVSHGRVEGASRRGQGTFTGVVHQDPVLDVRPAIAVNDNFFEPGARGYWHSHEQGQLLVVKAGHGHVHTRAGVSEPLDPGDVVYANPGEEHWHGAGANTYILHTAISMGVTTWLEEVSDKDYKDVAG
jgi:quercetin dioxygenase-like cupin family protein